MFLNEGYVFCSSWKIVIMELDICEFGRWMFKLAHKSTNAHDIMNTSTILRFFSLLL